MKTRLSSVALLWMTLMGVSLPALAQREADDPATTDMRDDRGGFDTGWLGLLGLIGLFGLKRRAGSNDRTYAGRPATAVP